MATKFQKEELRFVLTTAMAQCVMTSGMSWMLEWSARNLDTPEQVPKANRAR